MLPSPELTVPSLPNPYGTTALPELDDQGRPRHLRGDHPPFNQFVGVVATTLYDFFDAPAGGWHDDDTVHLIAGDLQHFFHELAVRGLTVNSESLQAALLATGLHRRVPVATSCAILAAHDWKSPNCP